ncbi:MAG TPA: SMP-30/gluconolactonase/LRE family protein [Coriobacteriia bacterium]
MRLTEGQATLELVSDAHATVGEGPVWDTARGNLWWVDIPAGLVHCFDPRRGADGTVAVGSAVGAVALRRDGTLLVALAERLAMLDPDSGQLESLLSFAAGDRSLRCNDGKCDPAGRFWVGRMAPDGALGEGALLRIDADLTPVARLTGLSIPNGLGWSLDGRRMYFVDSAWCEVRSYPYDPETGVMGDGRTLVRFPNDGSVPDGLTVDAEGHLWVARWGAGCVVRIAPDGSIAGRVDLPASQVSSVTFGGDDLGDLYITTAHEDFSAADLAREPLAGGLFRCRPGVRGLPPIPFAG